MRFDPDTTAAARNEFASSGFDGLVTSRAIGRLQVSRVVAHRTQVLRWTFPMDTGCTQPRFMLVRMRSGQGWLHHRGRELPLGPDECVLLDEHEPSETLLCTGSESLWFHLPLDWVESFLPHPQVAIALPLGGRQPWSAVLRDVMDTIHDDHASAPPLVARSLCSALALTVDDLGSVRATAHARKTFELLQRTLARLACTCNVTVSQIAQAHGISPRYVHAIFSANGTSCGRELMRVRLERALRLLRDPRSVGRSIDEIAWQCGFSDAGHFRRRFRAHFGVPPSALRLGHAPIGSPSEPPSDAGHPAGH